MTLGNDDPTKRDAETPEREPEAAPASTPDQGSPGPGESPAGAPDGGAPSTEGTEQALEIIREPEDVPAEEPRAVREPVKNRTRHTSRRELLELVNRKNSMLAGLDKELKSVKEQLSIKEDRYLRLAAEYENYRKRMRREWELHQKQANADLIREIVGGMDSFDRAYTMLGEADVQLRDGLRMIHDGLLEVLRKAGLSEIEALGQKFDPAIHEAMGEIESDDIEEGHVAQVVQRGYRLYDAVLRPARVLVSRR